MYIVDVSLKLTPMPFSVQRKTLEEAQEVYQSVLDALHSGQPQILELSCAQQTDKKVSLLTSEISAVQISEKSGAATGRTPGFFQVPDAE